METRAKSRRKRSGPSTTITTNGNSEGTAPTTPTPTVPTYDFRDRKETINRPIIRMRKPRGAATPYICFVRACRDRQKQLAAEAAKAQAAKAKAAKETEDTNAPVVVPVKKAEFKFSSFSKLCALNWNKFSKEERVPYVIMSRKDHIRYREEMSIYVPPPPRKVRKRRKKDPDAPKRNISAFFWFLSDQRMAIKALNPTYKFGEIAKELGLRWRQLHPGKKRKYERLAKRDKARYQQEKEVYIERVKAKQQGEYISCDELSELDE